MRCMLLQYLKGSEDLMIEVRDVADVMFEGVRIVVERT